MFKYPIIQLTACQFIGFLALGRIMEKLRGDLMSEDTEDNRAIKMFVSMALLSRGLVGHLIKRNGKVLSMNISKQRPSNAFN